MAGSTPIYGFPYPESSDLVANYPALGEQLAEDIESTISGLPAAGLSLVSPTSIANSGGSASASGGAVTFTGVSSVSLNGVFTSAYDNYRIVINAKSVTTREPLYLRLRATGTDLTSGYFGLLNGMYVNGSNYAIASSNVSAARICNLETDNRSSVSFDITKPYLSQECTINGLFFGGDNTASMGGYTNWYSNKTTAYDGLTLHVASNTFTGIIRVYGYKNS